MKRGLLDFVKDNPYTEEEELLPPEETEEKRLFRQIEEGIKQAKPPADVLKDCVSLIGLLAHNQSWADDLKAKLEQTEKDKEEFADFLG